MMNNQSAQQLWEEYRNAHPDAPETYHAAWAFGDNKKMADELAALVVQGIKTATASNYRLYELEGEALPQEGQLDIVLDGDGKAQAIIQTTTVTIRPFDEVPEAHAYKEGEGDRSLQYWREVHEDFFSREMQEAGEEYDPMMLVVCEEFRLCWKQSS